MEVVDVIGKWTLNAATPVATATLRIVGKLTVAPDGTLTFDEHFRLMMGDRVLSDKTKSTEGRWTIASDQLLAEVPGHVGSPYAFTVTSAGGLRWYTSAVWERESAER